MASKSSTASRKSAKSGPAKTAKSGHLKTATNGKTTTTPKASTTPKTPKTSRKPQPPVPESRADGLEAREKLPIDRQAEWPPNRLDRNPRAILAAQDAARLQQLVPIRYGRMLVSPFTYYRGSAAVMAADLATAPSSGLTVQLCGDAHLSNFGLFASPERSLLLDANDFDETYPGPFEWDLKRLAASVIVAGRDNGFSEDEQRRAALNSVLRYQTAMNRFVGMSELEVWYSRAEVNEVSTIIKDRLTKARRKTLSKQTEKARTRDSMQAYSKLTVETDGEIRLISAPPLIVPMTEVQTTRNRDDIVAEITGLVVGYRQTLPDNCRILLDRYEFVDMALKVVGVGSVGTRCWIVLMLGKDRHDPLFLQVKEAGQSVLAAHVPDTGGLPTYAQQGERVVAGQRLMQAASDIFLGWQSNTADDDGQTRDFYIRQLRDWKFSLAIENFSPTELDVWGQLCGWTLARAHARSGSRAAIAAYLGDDDTFAEAIADWSEKYADQTEKDHAALIRDKEAGTLEVVEGY